MGSDADQLEDGDDIGWEGDGGAGQQLVEQDIDGVEPVEFLGGRAVGYAFVVVTFAEVPEADLVEIV